MKARIHIKHGEIHFSNPVARRAFFERMEGKDGIIEADEAITVNSRRYFEGAVVPAVFYQHPKSNWIVFADAREALKLEFLPSYTHDLRGNRVKVAKSTTELTKAAFFKLLESITHWMTENGLEVPEPEDFKAWRDSAPAANEIYPPLLRLKTGYDRIKQTTVPPWRKKSSVAKEPLPDIP